LQTANLMTHHPPRNATIPFGFVRRVATRRWCSSQCSAPADLKKKMFRSRP
jgi:hypothetical protein